MGFCNTKNWLGSRVYYDSNIAQQVKCRLGVIAC